MGWELPQPIKPKLKPSRLKFGQLAKAVRMPYWFPFRYQVKRQVVMKKVCSEWKEEQFGHAIAKQNAHIAAQEAWHHQVHWQCADHGATP